MFRTTFSLGTSVSVVFPSRVLVFQLSVTPGEWPEADACVGTGVAPAWHRSLGGPWSSKRLLFPSSSPCPEEARGCCRGLAGPPH